MTSEEHVFPPKKAATEVKHLILDTYLSAWGGIIINSNQGRAIRLRFVDTCCGSGVYQPNPDDVETPDAFEPGSAIIGLSKLAELSNYARGKVASLDAKALLINKSSGEIRTLEEAVARNIKTPPHYETIVGRFEQCGAKIAEFCQEAFSFVFIDPYGPTPAPFSVVSRVVGQAYADSLINFPYLAIQKWSGWLGRNELSDDQVRKLSAIDAFFGDTTWRELAADALRSSKDLNDLLLRHYMSRLDALGLLAIAVPLLFEDRERIIYHLIFSSHNIAGLSAMKAAFRDGERYQAFVRDQRSIRRETRRTGQSMLDFGATASGGSIHEDVDIESVAASLVAVFNGRTVLFERVLLEGLRESDVLEGHVKRAMTLMRRAKAVEWPGSRLSYKSLVSFSDRGVKGGSR